MLEAAVVEAPTLSKDDGSVWIEALPARIYHTPQYGPVAVSPENLRNMVANFESNVRGQDVAMNFDHGMDRAKGNQASGWFRKLEIRPSSSDPALQSLYILAELTDEAKAEVKAKKWKYFSLEWDDDWMDNQGNMHKDVVIGGALTNKPIAKNVMPINFSEALWESLDYETKKAFAVWSTAFVNDLPDSSFLYITPGGKKDGEGKTVPRSLRHLPYKGPGGKIDLPHLRNAIARIPQMKGLSESLKSSLQSRARRLLGANSKALSEEVRGAMELLTAEGFDVLDESKEWEHSEPGTGSPPQPRTDEDGSDDIAIQQGWRVETPAIERPETPKTSDQATTTNGAGGGNGKLTPEQENELRKALGIADDGDIVEAVKLQSGEVTELRRNADAITQEKKFAEDYPAYWGEHQKLMTRDRENSARQFSESVSRVRKAEGFGLRETAKGLSMMSLTKIKDLHLHFAEGTATQEEFEECIKTIVNGGIVEFGEVGSSSVDDVPLIDTSSAAGIAGARKLFAEVIQKMQLENPEWEYTKCMSEAAKKHPDLAEAYSIPIAG